jgi:Domain of unknown function (DUF4145)
MADESDHKRIELLHCNSCCQTTRHILVHEHVQESITGYEGHREDTIWREYFTLLECSGCRNITLRNSCWNSDYDVSSEFNYFPPRISRPIPQWHGDLPPEFSSLMKEIYAALQADSRKLAIMGTRVLLEDFMIDKIGDIGGFEKKSEAMVEEGYLTKTQKRYLDSALGAGHAVAHRGYSPESNTVNNVIDIVESLLQTIILDKTADAVSGTTPPRKKK